MPIFCVKSVKIYAAKKIYTDGVSGVSDNYQVCQVSNEPNAALAQIVGKSGGDMGFC